MFHLCFIFLFSTNFMKIFRVSRVVWEFLIFLIIFGGANKKGFDIFPLIFMMYANFSGIFKDEDGFCDAL